MPSSLPAVIGALALAAAGFPGATAGRTIWVPLCHGSAIPIELPTKDSGGPGKSCPGGCHAACLGRKSDGCSEAEDSA